MKRIISAVSLLISILLGINGVSLANEPAGFVARPSIYQFFPGRLATIQLRWSPQHLNEAQVRQMIQTYGFYERTLNPDSDRQNVYLPMSIHGQVFVTDMRHDLLWATGADLYASSDSAAERIAAFCYAGYNDWRLPTLEELASLLENPQGRTHYYNEVFSDAPLETALTSDTLEGGTFVWSVRFDEGVVAPVSSDAFWKILAVRTGSKLPIRSKCTERLN